MKLTNFLLGPAVTTTFLSLSCLVASYTTLSDGTLKSLPHPDPDFDIHNGKLLAPILIPRVPGTPNSLKVLQHFTDFWAKELPKWKIEYDNSTSVTPLSQGKQVPFRNFMATRDPPWAQPGEVGRLVLVAHYDSKIYPPGFIGATDSAAPCAMLMHAARAIDGALTKKWGHMEQERKRRLEKREKGEDDDDLDDDDEEDKDDDKVEDKNGGKDRMWNRGVMILLLDGEEAFDTWTDKDSLYGARNLAETWEQSFHIAGSHRRTLLSSIDLFLLLDLLGARDPKVPSYFRTTHWAYKAMAKLEHRFRELGVFRTGKRHRKESFLFDTEKKEFSWGGGVQDDHIPFMKKGVEVLHIIPSPFPRVWHEIDDNGDNLHMDTVHDWAMLVVGFAAEWLELEGWFERGKDGGDKEALKARTEL